MGSRARDGSAATLSAVHVAGGGAYVGGGGGRGAPAGGHAPAHDAADAADATDAADAADGGRAAAADARASARLHAASRDGRLARYAAVQSDATHPARSVPTSVLPPLGFYDAWRIVISELLLL